MTAPEVPDRPAAVIDQRPRQLLEKYASLVGALLMDIGDGLVEFEVPPGERAHWGRDRVVRIALVPEALEEAPEAELLGIGSAVFERLVAAIRVRGFFQTRGLVPPSERPSSEAPPIGVPLEDVATEVAKVEVTLLPVGRLWARVSIKAGPRLDERMVDSPPIDLSTGVTMSAEIAEALAETNSRPQASPPTAAQPIPKRAMEEILPLIFEDLENQLASDIAGIREEAEGSKKAEVDRLERYYGAMIEEVEPGKDPDAAMSAKRVIRAELERRKNEEEDRFRVRVTVHPLQLIEWQVLAQRATWILRTPAGREARLHATRLLSGDLGWRLKCPSCGQLPTAIRVCQNGHASCPECSERCGVCGETACRTHGMTTCAAEGHPVCGEHARTCGSCQGSHCSAHSRRCAVGDHEICPSCAVHCGRCGVALCRAHGIATLETAPKGARWLCSACTVLCEGGTNEPVGLDEVVPCTSCKRHICEVHRVACAVDGEPHCSRHLRRSDRSGRLTCEAHRASCSDEPGSVLASDEVGACSSCGKAVCEVHGGVCDADGARHCAAHLAPLADRSGRKGCEKCQHRLKLHTFTG